jgi:hypothetical protein
MEINNFQEEPQGQRVIATFDLYLGPQWGITYKRLKLVKGKHGPFIQMPCYCEETDGQKRFYPYVEMSREKKAVFDAKVMDLIKPFCINLRE